MNFGTITAEHIQVFLLVFVRVTAIVSLLPVFGSQNIPVQLKAGFSFLLAVLVFPMVMADYTGAPQFTAALFVVAVLKEIIVGIVIGLLVLKLNKARSTDVPRVCLPPFSGLETYFSSGIVFHKFC